MSRLPMLLLCLLTWLWIASNPWLTAAPPNVVLIIADDQAWTDYSFMGHPHVKTPQIDRLAQTGMTFRRGYVPSSLCCPSLATILTGRYPHEHRVTSNDPPRPPGVLERGFYQSAAYRDGRETMNQQLARFPTLPRLLAASGYESLQTGKWWQGDYSRGGFTHGMTRGQRHGDEGLTIGRQSMQPIRQFIQAAQSRNHPFLVWYAPMMPHSPHTPPERLFKKYAPLTDSPHIARYWAMIEWFDETIGELQQILDEQHVRQNTLIVFVADNGWIQRPDSPQYAPRSKQSPYEGGLRTPMILNLPGRIAPGMSDTPVLSIDLLPTILRIVGSKPPEQLPGIDLLDMKAVTQRPAIFGECFTHQAVDLTQPAANLRFRWVISGGQKLILPEPRNEPKSVVELFDLSQDPTEMKDLAAAQPKDVQRLRTLLDRWWNPAASSP